MDVPPGVGGRGGQGADPAPTLPHTMWGTEGDTDLTSVQPHNTWGTEGDASMQPHTMWGAEGEPHHVLSPGAPGGGHALDRQNPGAPSAGGEGGFVEVDQDELYALGGEDGDDAPLDVAEGAVGVDGEKPAGRANSLLAGVAGVGGSVGKFWGRSSGVRSALQVSFSPWFHTRGRVVNLTHSFVKLIHLACSSILHTPSLQGQLIGMGRAGKNCVG